MEIKKVFDRPYLLQFILIIIATVVYGQVYFFEYNLDDEIILQAQNFSKSWAGFVELINAPYFNDSNGFSYGYRPMSSLSFYLESLLFGHSSGTSHAINLTVYILNVLMIFHLGRAMLKENAYAFLLALLFLIHPLHVEVVASIKNRDELLALFFVLAAWTVMKKDLWINVVLTFLLILFSLLSKKSGIGLLLFAPIAGITIYKWTNPKYWFLGGAMCVSLFYFFPSESTTIRLFSSVALFGFYLIILRGRYHLWHLNMAFLCEVLSISAILVGIFGLLRFDLTLLILSSCTLSLTYFLKPSRPSALVLVVIIGVLSIVSHNWAVLLLVLVLFQVKPTSEDQIFRMSLLIGLSGLCIWHLFTHSDWISLLFAILYVLPFVWQRIKTKLVLRVGFFSISMGFIFNAISFSKWAYLAFLGALIVFYLLMLKDKIRPKVVISSLLVVLSLLVIDPAVFVSQTFQESSAIIEEAIQVTNDGRELFFMENPMADEGLVQKFVASTNTYGHYLGKFFAPTDLAAYYGFDTVDLLSPIQGVLTGLLVLAVVVLLWRFEFRHALIAFILFLISLFPFGNLIVPVAGIVGDRLMFTPSLLLCLSIVLLFKDLNSLPKRFALGAVLVWLIPLSFLSWKQTSVWKNKEVLYLHSIDKQPRSVKMNELVADWYYFESQDSRETRLPMAFEFYQNAARIFPDYDRSWYMMGKITQEQGRFVQALKYYKNVSEMDFVQDDYYLNTGICALEVGDFVMADDFLKKAISISRTSLSAYQNLVLLYLKAERPRLALSAGEAALDQFPTDIWLNRTQGNIYENLGDTEMAQSFYQKVSELEAE